LRLARSQPA